MKYIETDVRVRYFLTSYFGKNPYDKLGYIHCNEITKEIWHSVGIESGGEPIDFKEFLKIFLESQLKDENNSKGLYEGLSNLSLMDTLGDTIEPTEKFDGSFIISLDHKLDRSKLEILGLVGAISGNHISTGELTKKTLVFYRKSNNYKLSSWDAKISTIISQPGWDDASTSEMTSDTDFVRAIYDNCGSFSRLNLSLITNLLFINKSISVKIASKITQSIYRLINTCKIQLPSKNLENYEECTDRLQEQKAEVRTGTELAGSIIHGRKSIASVKVGSLSYKART